MQSSAAGNASKLAANDARMAYMIQDAKLAPYRAAGEHALGQAEGIVGGGWGGYQDQMRAGFRTDPGYEFMLQQGLRGTNATQSAAHMFDSGATHKADIAFAEGLANQQYNQYAGRFDNYVNKLYAMAGAGQNSAVQQGTNAMNTASNLGNIALGQAGAQNAILGNATQGFGNAVNTLFGNKDFQNLISGSGGSNSVYSSTPNLIWNPNNPVGTSTLGGATANQGWFGNNFG